MVLRATEREKLMDQAIAGMRRPYNYEITKEKLNKAADETHKELAKYGKRKSVNNHFTKL